MSEPKGRTVNGTNKSSYQPDKTVQQVADEHAAALVERSRNGKVSAYGRKTLIALTYTLAGGGPAEEITIVGEGRSDDGDGDIYDVSEAIYTYYDGAGQASVYLEAYHADRIYRQLEDRPGDEDDEEVNVEETWRSS